MTRKDSRDADRSQSGSTPQVPDTKSIPGFICGPPLQPGFAYQLDKEGSNFIARAKLLDENALSEDRIHPCAIHLDKHQGIEVERKLTQLPTSLSIAIPEELLVLVVDEFGEKRLGESAVVAARRRNIIAANMGAIGFWNRYPILYPYIEPPKSSGFPGMTGEMFNRTDNEIHRIVATLEQRLNKIAEFVQGYAGWLMSNPQFRSEQQQLLQEFRSEIVTTGFPTRRTLCGGVPSANPAYHERCQAHFERWILDGVAGPDYPIPVSPQFPNPMPPETNTGVLSHVIPAYFPVHGQGWLNDMLDDTRPTNRQMPHLEDWFEIVRKENASLNKVLGYRRRLRLLHYWRGVMIAFPDGLRRSKSRMIVVFAEFLKVDPDTIKSDLKVLQPFLIDDQFNSV